MTETPKYDVIKRAKRVELRRYPAHIKAEAEVSGLTYQKAIYQGFSILAGYIFGDNVAAEKIAMTSPVQVSNPQKIAMTKPVTVSGDGTYSVAFIMPGKYTLESLPKPKDPRITITKIDSQVMAALRFSGYFSENKVRKAKQKLQDWIVRDGLAAEGDFIVARYNPPWVPWFLARNEVMIRIKSGPGQ
ncbi:MAG: heme-binding protein [Brevefilum sp.]|nr:heme-binding protein [Brevefilum sp.]